MADGTAIEWTDASWNPIRARVGDRIGWHCEILTPGCERCYAEAINHRLGTGDDYLKKSSRAEIFLDEKILAQPLHWRRPRRIFVCSMSDLFGKWVSDEMNDRVLRGLVDEEKPIPSGCAIIERIGWDEDGRFTATLHFPTGAPDIQALVVWRKTPVRLVVAESDNG